MDYAAFLRAKDHIVEPVGFDVDDLGAHLYPFQVDIVRWACRLGRAAVFADCGMGKTAMQLEWAKHVADHSGGKVLILAPLAVAAQTVREGERFGVPVAYSRSGEADQAITNYEMLDAFDVDEFAGIVLDESSILKAFDGKTRTQIIESFRSTPFRLACTATPAPNDFMELGNHAEFLGVMTRAEMLSMFFVHDGGSTQDWRLKGHAEADFWRWVCRWAVLIRKPSDLGYDDGGFVLPPLHMHERVVGVDHKGAWNTGNLFALEALTLADRGAARRGTIDDRVQTCADLVAANPAGPWLIWCGLNDEGDRLTAAIPGAVQVAGSDTREHKESSLLAFAEGKIPVLISKSSIAGYGMNFQKCAHVAFVGLSG